MATRAFEENYIDGRIGIKKLFYVLRPLLACRWIERKSSQPPTPFAELVAAECLTTEERDWIADLLQRKADSREAAAISLDPSRAADIRSELHKYEAAAAHLTPPMKASTVELDAVLRTWTGV
jgi:predicted nucleotidyltransferase